jgi:hypothetical protein
MADAVDFINTLNREDLHQLESAIERQLTAKPITVTERGAEPLFDDKLQVFDGIGDNDILNTFEFYPDEIYSVLIKWNNGDETKVRVATQEGLMSAGTVRFVIEYVQIGDLGMIGSFPSHCDGLCDGVEGYDELAEELQKHDITSKDDIASFISWILYNVLPSTRCPISFGLVEGPLQDFYDEEYFPAEEEEDEEEGEKQQTDKWRLD